MISEYRDEGHYMTSVLTERQDFDPITEAILACLEIILIVHPYHQVVNSVIIGQVRPRARSGPRLLDSSRD